MQDNLKNHIDKNRDDFELYPFEPLQDWDKIANQLEPNKSRSKGWIMGIAASLAFLIISFVLVSNSGEQLSEVAEIESFYQDEINQKITLVKNQIGDDPVLEDLEAMDIAFSELRADLDENVDNEEVVVAMMENYRLKLQILTEILNELEKENGE